MGLVASPRECAGSAASWTTAPSSCAHSAHSWCRSGYVRAELQSGDATLSAQGWRPVAAFSRVWNTVALSDALFLCLICPVGAGEFVHVPQDEPSGLLQEWKCII